MKKMQDENENPQPNIRHTTEHPSQISKQSLSTSNPPPTTSHSTIDHKYEKILEDRIQFVTQRRQMFDQLVWQIPPLSLTGESFLFLISLGAGVSNIARIIAALLGIVVALCCMHSLDRLKVSEWYDAHILRVLMRRDPQQIPAVLGSEYRRELAKYYKTTWKRDYDWWFSSNCEGMGEFFQFTSILSWTFCFWAIILANSLILALSAIQFNTDDNRYFS